MTYPASTPVISALRSLEVAFCCISAWTRSSAAEKLELTCLTVWHRFQSAFIFCVVCLIEFCIFPPTALCLIFNSLITGFIPGSHGRLNSSEHSASLSVSVFLSQAQLSPLPKASQVVSGDALSEWKLHWIHEVLKCLALRCVRARSV